ncbi:MAG TPA: DEAD/DEAH box helicase family protein [Candidatus Angelobacter sp.]|nr:DEAD/DEAH box helicase family protein [Candidatus Angelobacter sp.]
MELKEFQQKALDTLGIYLDKLREQEGKAEKIRKANESQSDPDLKLPMPDFSRVAWEQLHKANLLPEFRWHIEYSGRKDGMNNDVPNVCLKIPTGGGKTLLAAYSVSHIMGRYLRRNTGFVLWIVPNEAIYTQTKKYLSNRENPLRQTLDRAAAGRVKVLEKDDPLNILDVESHLCVMLLMLQSANRETKETLRLFRDRGNVHGFFPPADDIQAHFALLGKVRNLSCYGQRDTLGATAHESLGNVLRLVRPVVVMDEGHKAYTTSAMNTLFDFNPSFVLELSATPKDRPKDDPPRYANWLVEVAGTDLQREQMIKLPINVTVKAGDDWKLCLRESLDHLNKLQKRADKLLANTSQYIRPILLVQVERTGKDQREKNVIHSEDARQFLLDLGLDKAAIAVKTSETNELNQPENIDLMSRTCAVRVIITKQALQEGWDCPFAYVLCALAASHNQNAMTQLVGRILRQPETRYTDDEMLNESYVFCHHVKTKDVIEAIKTGLEKDGMADVAGQVRETLSGTEAGKKKRTVGRREKFRKLDIYLPMVNWVAGEDARPLDYEQDVLYRLDWSQLDMKELAEKLAKEVDTEKSQMLRLTLAEGSEFLTASEIKAVAETLAFDPVYATRSVVDIVPNPWVARAAIEELVAALLESGFDDAKLGSSSIYILEELRKWLLEQRDLLAEEQFMKDVAAEKIQFRLRADRELWRMPAEIETGHAETAQQLARNSGEPLQKSLFSPVYFEDFNTPEREFACYLDEKNALRWWHRNVAKTGYSIQGWKKNRVYPDFIFARERTGKADRLFVWEMKGPQLEGNLDTEYKKKLLETMSAHYKTEDVVKAGKLQLKGAAGELVECDLVFLSEWKTKINVKWVD